MNQEGLKIFLKHKWVKIGVIINLFILFITLIIILINIKPIPNRSYIIYYTSLEGIKLLGYFWNFYLFWFIAFFFFVLHLFLSFIIWFKNKKISLLLIASVALLNFFIFLAINSLVVVNR
ncbi:MAG: hypothetical protein ACPLKV_03120 [Minisyncoccia bacterium]